ncbi:MAG: hypothetical protein Q7R62_02620 [bacterium]|nr:hypothetical protein [bacterium]
MSKLSSLVFPVRFVNLREGWFLMGSESTQDAIGNWIPPEITLFAHWTGAKRPIMRGTEVALECVPGREVKMPAVGTLVEVTGEIVTMLDKTYPRVTGWAISEQCEKTCASADKARETLVRLAQQAEEENRRRQEARANSCRKGASSGGGGHHSRQKAGSRR